MAKTAGRKNDGAWYRGNKMIKILTPEEKGKLKALILADGFASGAFDIHKQMADDAGVSMDGAPVDASSWVDNMLNFGVPRQVYMGKQTHPQWERSGAPGAYIYTPAGTAAIQDFGESIRKTLSRFQITRRQLLDVFNYVGRAGGNPGGFPDIDPAQ